jgi:hypothetical protein
MQLSDLSLLLPLSKIKNALYMYMCLAEDIETQKKGCVFIVFRPSPSTQVCASAEERGFVQRLMSSIPIRVSAIHVCLYDDALSKIIKSVFLVAIGPEGRARTRIHTGMLFVARLSLDMFPFSRRSYLLSRCFYSV